MGNKLTQEGEARPVAAGRKRSDEPRFRLAAALIKEQICVFNISGRKEEKDMRKHTAAKGD